MSTLGKICVVLLGKVGHGKTTLLNKLCGTHFATTASATACTGTLQVAYTRQDGIAVVDSPGYASSQDVSSHITAQVLALEDTPISGIYLVAKFGRTDEITESVTQMMDYCCADDDVRIIVTHCDVAINMVGCNLGETKEYLSELTDVPLCNIAMTGTHTDSEDLESFLRSTVHVPRLFLVHPEQAPLISSLAEYAQKFQRTVVEMNSQLECAMNACDALTASHKSKSYDTDVKVAAIMWLCTRMMRQRRNSLLLAAAIPTDPDQQCFADGKAALMDIAQPVVSEALCGYFSWDLADAKDPRNMYKQCHHCLQVFFSECTPASAHSMSCSAEPNTDDRQMMLPPSVEAKFQTERTGKEWQIGFYCQGSQLTSDFSSSFLNTRKKRYQQAEREKAEPCRCCQQCAWASMLPIDPDLVDEMTKEPENEDEDFLTVTSCVCCNLTSWWT
jgi:small GTP-binding protein